ncbi:MAG TPA: cysteine dioxygenase family protein [Candidatus Binatia bacterium]|nr:cysteine dioxygenase family protein [Candidatus Binatia bacterium]HET9881240.1 cysteine dioxygenase family protein [Candidatus Binatia bacterium]
MASQNLLSMEAFLDGINDVLRRGFATEDIHTHLQKTLIEPDSLQRYIFFRPERYTRNLVFKNEFFELLVICWNIGQRAPVHGHEGERCWSRVEQGSLILCNYREVSENPLVVRQIGEPYRGERGHLDGPANIHSVANPSMVPAVSLHLYSHPYDQCDIYDLENNLKQRVRLRYDSIDGKVVEPF